MPSIDFLTLKSLAPTRPAADSVPTSLFFFYVVHSFSTLLISALNSLPFSLPASSLYSSLLAPTLSPIYSPFRIMTADCCAVQLIDSKGEFNVEGLESFMNAWNLANGGPSYGVVSILGPQSSGKSTLLNHLFRTNFVEMDAAEGRAQTTKGIWIANCVGIEPPTICIDMEGTDGKERGEGDTAFEKKSALFALAISDVLMINMWYHDIGRESAANRPLLRTIFKVMMRLFSPRKSTLLLVIRDKPKCPSPNLENYLRKDMEEIWDAVIKTHDVHMNAPLNQFSEVKITFLSSYEWEPEKFKEQVAELGQQFFHSSSPEGLACSGGGVAPAAGFSLRTQQIWNVIKECKDLDLPTHKIMVSTIRCEEIANEKLGRLTNEGWLALEGDVKGGLVSDAAIRQANWDASNVRDKLRGGVDEHASAVRSSQLAKLRTTYEEQVRRDLKDPVKSLLREGSPEDAWASIRNRLESLTAVSEFSNAINKFNLDQAAVDTRVQEIRDYARSLVKQVAREACEEVLILMKQRFFDKLYPDTDSRPSFWRPSFWTNRKDIATITMDACSEALKLLSVMTAIRLTERQDNISHLLFSSLIVDPSSQDITVGVPTNCLGLSTWEELSGFPGGYVTYTKAVHEFVESVSTGDSECSQSCYFLAEQNKLSVDNENQCQAIEILDICEIVVTVKFSNLAKLLTQSNGNRRGGITAFDISVRGTYGDGSTCSAPSMGGPAICGPRQPCQRDCEGALQPIERQMQSLEEEMKELRTPLMGVHCDNAAQQVNRGSYGRRQRAARRN
ncbi:hypothetical protein CJ030_MR1G002811 [Morella rubra]|uniref:GB1/RHD3-type G domain-containing protein n=1 Tax=Morella rubra TaxID=262757 RepID=A0A6A1WM83_9ROSI|nr:hypothetical protein CJ030_MR1G002811 [Morella rubra]